MELVELFSAQLTQYCTAGITNKKKSLERLSALICKENTDLKPGHILNALHEREKIGDTAFGHGVAIPHARLEALTRPVCAVLYLKNPINFSITEEKMVDLVFGLLVPKGHNEEHLQFLSGITDKLREETFRKSLRACDNSNALYQQLIKEYDGNE